MRVLPPTDVFIFRQSSENDSDKEMTYDCHNFQRMLVNSFFTAKYTQISIFDLNIRRLYGIIYTELDIWRRDMSDFQKYLDESLSKVKIPEVNNINNIDSKNEIYTDLCEMIIRERKEQNITQKQLAEKTGLSQSNISSIEKGSTRPTIETLIKIADALGKRLNISFEESEVTYL